MARKPRDYRAEYQRRVEREKERARKGGYQFDLAKARGHHSREAEKVERRVRKARKTANRTAQGSLADLIEASRYGLPRGEWQAIVDEALRLLGEEWVRHRLENKIVETEAYHGPDDPGPGQDEWSGFRDLEQIMPYVNRAMYFYHKG